MKGIDFVVDEKGKKKAVILNLEEFGPDFEGFIDGLVSMHRLREQKQKTDFAALRRRMEQS